MNEATSSTPLALAPLVLPGRLTIRNAHAVRDLLLEALNGSSSLCLDIPPYAEIDLSFLQIVEAARLTADRRGTTLCLSRPASSTLLAALERSGFLHPDDLQSCQFWLHRKDTQ
ncbi:STAS domain-containing protein [Allorhizobium undicola]|uniref:STAS domain-containing protein n=1 Tax=Allorhizobium undicola TaxID=78527 RepID=UPI003D35242D